YYCPVNENFNISGRSRLIRHQVFHKMDLSINENPCKTLLQQNLQLLFNCPVHRYFEGTGDHYLIPFFKCIDIVHHIGDGIMLDLLTTDGRYGPADPAIEELEIIVYLRGRTDGGS